MVWVPIIGVLFKGKRAFRGLSNIKGTIPPMGFRAWPGACFNNRGKTHNNGLSLLNILLFILACSSVLLTAFSGCLYGIWTAGQDSWPEQCRDRVTTLTLPSIVSPCHTYFWGLQPRTVPNNPLGDVGHLHYSPSQNFSGKLMKYRSILNCQLPILYQRPFTMHILIFICMNTA